MSKGELFIKTLKKIGYNEADNLEECDFDWMFSNDDLKPFLEVFCSLDENNVLTSEELQEFSSLTAGELAEIEVLEKSGQIEKNTTTIEEKKEETNFLYGHLKQIEHHNKTLEGKIELFKKHEKHILDIKGKSEKLFLEAKEKYHSNAVPQAESEFSSSLESIFKIVQDLKSIILQADTDKSKIPTSDYFKNIIREYVEVEEKILQCVKVFLNNNFQLQEIDHVLSFTSLNFNDEELQKEALFLQKTMKENIAEKIMSEKEIKKYESFLKDMEKFQKSDFNSYSLDHRSKLEDTLELNQKLKKDEQDLCVHLSDAISKLVDARFSEVALSADKQTRNHLEHAREEIFLAVNTLLHQRARLEMLIVSLHQYNGELHELKKIIENAFNQIEHEYEHMEERKMQTENILKKLEPKKNGDSEVAIYSSIYKILTTASESENPELCSISSEDVLKKVIKLFQAKENLSKKHEEKLKTIESMEKHADSLEALLTCTDKEYLNWHELEQDANAALNNLVMQSAAAGSSFAECSKELNTHEELLEKKANLRLARNLYIYALMNKEIFKKCIDDIQEAIDLN